MSYPDKFWAGLLWFGSMLSCLRAEMKVGEVFPALSEVGLVSPVTAGKITVVDFWASWCAPCKESFPAYAQLQADYTARGLIIVAVSVDENPDAFARFVKKMHPAFTVWRDENHRLVQRVNVPAMPTCYLLGRDGRVRFVHQGFHGTQTERQIRQEIDLLLAENLSAAP